jgi:hypothetical protein
LTFATDHDAASSHPVTTLYRQVRGLVVKQLCCFNSSDLIRQRNWRRVKRKPRL